MVYLQNCATVTVCLGITLLYLYIYFIYLQKKLICMWLFIVNVFISCKFANEKGFASFWTV